MNALMSIESHDRAQYISFSEVKGTQSRLCACVVSEALDAGHSNANLNRWNESSFFEKASLEDETLHVVWLL
jgi:hypothetical protein